MMEFTQTNLFEDREEILQENFEWQVRHITFLLMTATGIDPERDNLTLLLGTGNDDDNIQAVRVWVRKELCCPSCARSVKLGHLYTKLQELMIVRESQ